MKRVIRIKAKNGEEKVEIVAKINTNGGLGIDEVYKVQETLRDNLVEVLRDLPYLSFYLSQIQQKI